MSFKLVFLFGFILFSQNDSLAQNTRKTTTTTTVTKRVNGKVIHLEKNGKVLYSEKEGSSKSDNSSQQNSSNSKKVLVCFGPEAYAYHSSYCIGAQNCSVKIDTVSLSEAKAFNRTPCEICY